ncbi:MAG TPA: hemolysin III family protein [Bacteroidia bacterium]
MVANTKKIKRVQTPNEELANTLTHAIGIVFILVTLPFLWEKAQTNTQEFTMYAIGIYVLGMLAVYCSSTLYHYLKNPILKERAHIADHISIFLLIGGTYTPIVYLFTPWETSSLFLSIMWGIIALGVVMKVFFTGKYTWVSTILYLALGWMVVFLYSPLNESMNWFVFQPILIGGLAYTIGVLFYIRKKMLYSHAIWHLFVLAGTIYHWVAIFRAL